MRTPGRKVCRYEYDHWYAEDGRLYLKATGIEYERSNEEAFAGTVTRRMREQLRRDGVVITRRGVEEWDRSYNIADGLQESVTYRTIAPVLMPALQVA